jgi:glycosyltransferase involved in cell wall biosynthesis
MRIVQVIDSLEVGGAERMAVNYANALANVVAFSGLVATRKEGSLKAQIDDKVDYLFLNRKRTIDWSAIFRLKAYCKKHKIDYIQPHSSSYFIAFFVKLMHPKIQIIWHDHNGLSEFLGSQKWIPLKIASFFFKGIIVVNYQLKAWAERELYCKRVLYLPNFTIQESLFDLEKPLYGQSGKRILCLANLRDQKNHFLLIKVAERLQKSHPDWSFHLVGKDFKDDYSKAIQALVTQNKLEQTVFFYGTRNDAAAIIDQSDIAILTSKSEGLPVALLEYGLYKKPVVVTEVGEIPLIINNAENGYIVPSNDEKSFYDALVSLIENPKMRDDFSVALHKTITDNHSEEAVISKYINWINHDVEC